MVQSAVRELDVERKLRRKTKVIDLEGTIAQIEDDQPPCDSIMEAELMIA